MSPRPRQFSEPPHRSDFVPVPRERSYRSRSLRIRSFRQIYVHVRGSAITPCINGSNFVRSAIETCCITITSTLQFDPIAAQSLSLRLRFRTAGSAAIHAESVRSRGDGGRHDSGPSRSRSTRAGRRRLPDNDITRPLNGCAATSRWPHANIARSPSESSIVSRSMTRTPEHLGRGVEESLDVAMRGTDGEGETPDRANAATGPGGGKGKNAGTRPKSEIAPAQAGMNR